MHFKFIDDVVAQSSIHQKSQTRTRGGYYEALYQNAVNRREGRSFKDQNSVRFRDSGQLVELGLLKSSSDYEAYLKRCK